MSVVELKKGFNDQVVETLETLLEEAKAGEVIQLIVLAQYGNGYNHYYTGTDSIPEIIGQLEIMKDKQIIRSRGGDD